MHDQVAGRIATLSRAKRDALGSCGRAGGKLVLSAGQWRGRAGEPAFQGSVIADLSRDGLLDVDPISGKIAHVRFARFTALGQRIAEALEATHANR